MNDYRYNTKEVSATVILFVIILLFLALIGFMVLGIGDKIDRLENKLDLLSAINKGDVFEMEMMWVIGRQAIDKVDFETADEKGEHWRIRISERQVQRMKVFKVPKDRFTLKLVDDGILEQVDFNTIMQREGLDFDGKIKYDALVSEIHLIRVGSKQKDVRITVGLPMFRSRYIGWLAMESLCNQQSAPPWELIICEERESRFEPFGMENIQKYIERLKKANCINIYYCEVPIWIPLSQKWQWMARNANGVALVMQAADCYAQPYRLKETYDIMKSGRTDWCQSIKGYFYSICSENVYYYDGRKNDHPCALNMAFKIKLGRQLPNDDVTRSVDRWLFESLKKIKGEPLKVRLNNSNNWMRGIDTHGLGNISMYREIGFDNHPIWQKTDIQVDEIVGMEYVFKLKLLKGFVREDRDYRPWNRRGFK